jgi:hypothetical protein
VLRAPGWRACLALSTCGCVTFSPVAAQVAVRRQDVKDLSVARNVPAGCRLVASKPKVSMMEIEMDGSNQPYRRQREEAASAGANLLVVRAQLIRPRGDFDCPSASPITDCLSGSGAWFDVVFESYACPSEALQELAARKPQG